MLIRKPISTVFQAFTDPSQTTKFWFTRSTGPLEEGSKVTWYWDMYGVSGEVKVVAIEPERRIAIEWPTPVEWLFTPRGDDATLVSVAATGFTGTDDEKVAGALDSMSGFSLVLASCKAFLEHGLDLNLIRDHNPDALVR